MPDKEVRPSMPAVNIPRFRNPLMIVEEPVHQVAAPVEGGIVPPWDPAGDVQPPPEEGARAYVPPRERVPAMTGVSEERRKPVGPLEQVMPYMEPIGELRRQLGFVAHSVQIDNLSSQWLLIPAARRYVPPFTWGVVLPLLQNTEVAQYTIDAPTGYTQLGALAGALVCTIWSAAMLPPSCGFPIPTTQHP